MRVLILSPFNPKYLQQYLDTIVEEDINISANSVHGLVEGFIKRGIKVDIVTINYSVYNTNCYKGNNVNISVVGGKQKFSYFNHAPFHCILAYRIIKSMNKYIDYTDVILANWSYEYSLAAMKYRLDKPVFSVVRDWAPYIFKSVRFYLKPFWLRRILLQLFILNSSKINIIANSVYTKERICSMIKSKPISVIPNSISSDCILHKPKSSIYKYTFVSITATLTSKRKNIETLLYAFCEFRRKYNSATLAIIAPVDSIIKQWKKKGLLENVFFLGSMHKSGVLSVIDDSMIMVHPALEETFGNTLIESMARCVPVIGGKNAGAVPWVLGYGNNGCLCNVGDPQSICEAMFYVYENADYRKELIRNGLVYISNNFSDNVVCDSYIKTFQSKINEDTCN